MSRRRNNDGPAVRGPTSALTSFLAGLGVEAPVGNPYANFTHSNQDAGPSGTTGPEAEDEVQESLPAHKRKRALSVDSDDLDDGEFTPELTSAGTSAAPSGLSTPTVAVRPGPLKGVGEFMNCGECGKKFTVTAYTKEHPNRGSTYLCTVCCRKLGINPYEKAKKARKPAAKKAERGKIVHYEVAKGAPPLGDLCIKLIGNYIEDVDALGDIGLINLDKVCKIISKGRRLTPETAPLFYSVERTELSMYDCTNLTSDSYLALARLCPNLTRLNLQYCGQMSTDVLVDWSTSMRHLRSLELFGPFLVRKDGWITFFKTIGEQLEELIITQSPRIDLEIIEVMVEHCPNLRVLHLTEIGKLESDFLVPLAKLQHLESLAIVDPGTPAIPGLSDEAITTLLSSVGGNLRSLDLSDNPELEDSILDAIVEYCPKLEKLALRNVEISDTAMTAFFKILTTSKHPGFKHLDLEKGHELGTATLQALTKHSKKTLEWLSIMGWRAVSADAVARLADCPKLRFLDLGWCRNVTDFTLKDILEGCDNIEEIRVWGCNQLTDRVPRKRGVRVVGIETHAI